ncbi:hypothetical protein CNR22_00975 [Sphingobacteriaceae bacterium]|nr:hypothetical protein CNR22_00975 [Sphingobacteriaceae bacterium]
MLQKFLLLFVLFNFTLGAQSPKVSGPELGWALAHPFAAIKIKRLTNTCNQLNSVSKPTLQLDSFSNGGKADAYRHAFYMAAYAQKITIRKLRKLGRAHEKANYQQFLKAKKEDGEVADSLSCVMDLANNELGFKIGSEHKKNALKELSLITIKEIQNGQAIIMKRDGQGNYLMCDGRRINLSLYRGVWYVPKCLVKSSDGK